jgi:hypothetical protein
MVYASVVALFLLKSPDVTAQTKPVVEQAPAEPRDTFVVLQSLDGLQTTAYSTTSKRFGGAIAIRSQHLTLWMRIRKFFTTNKAK